MVDLYEHDILATSTSLSHLRLGEFMLYSSFYYMLYSSCYSAHPAFPNSFYLPRAGKSAVLLTTRELILHRNSFFGTEIVFLIRLACEAKVSQIFLIQFGEIH